METTAQILIAVIWIVGLFFNLYHDVNGRTAKEPEGFSGVVSTIVASSILAAIYYYAGAFSKIF